MNRYLIVYQCSIKRMLSTDITDRFSLGRCRRPQGSAHCCCTDTRNSCTTKELFSADAVCFSVVVDSFLKWIYSCFEYACCLPEISDTLIYMVLTKCKTDIKMLYWVSNISWRVQTYNAVLTVSMLTGICLFRDMRSLVPCLFNGCQKSHDETSKSDVFSCRGVSMFACMSHEIRGTPIDWNGCQNSYELTNKLGIFSCRGAIGLPVCSIRPFGALCFCKGCQKSNDETNKIGVFSRGMLILLGSLEIKCWLTRFEFVK